MSARVFDKFRRTALSKLFSVVVVFAVVLVSSNVSAKTYRLRFSTSYRHHEPPAIFARGTLKLIEKKTNGKVKFKLFENGTLGGPHEQLGLVQSGAADVISLHIDQYPQDLPLHQVTNVELLSSGEKGLKDLAALVHEIPETKKLFYAEQNKANVRILYSYVNGATGITTKVKVSSLQDLNGKRINVLAGYQRNVFNEVGWLPVNVVIPELYEALSRGVIDSIFMATAATIPLKWHEVGEYHVRFKEHTIVSSPLAVNLDKWNSFPADIKQAFWEASMEVAMGTAKGTEMALKKTYDVLEKTGVKIFDVSKSESDHFFEVLFKHFDDHWMEMCEKAGVKDQANAILKYYEKMRWGKW